MSRRAFVTGTAGFIGYHTARVLLEAGWEVVGLDGMTPYYDPALKRARHAMLEEHGGFTPRIAQLEDASALARIADDGPFDTVVHLAAQAGVRYSMEAPQAYMDTNVQGTFNVISCARDWDVAHLVLASSSSVYGMSDAQPFVETTPTDQPVSLYAATKKAGEAMGHAWARVHALPTTSVRFFTVYGPWGRPDMALFKFTKAMLEGESIDLYNHGDQKRDFTYVDDLVAALVALIDRPPPLVGDRPAPLPGDSLSSVAPYRVVNLGNGTPVALGDFVAAIEAATGVEARRKLLPPQPGDVSATWADMSLAEALIGPVGRTPVTEGVAAFVRWYRDYYDV